MTKTYYIILTILLLFNSCELGGKDKKQLQNKTESFYELKLPASFDANFSKHIDYKNIEDEEFISKFLTNESQNSSKILKYFGGEKYELNEDVDILLCGQKTKDGEFLQLITFKNGEKVDTYNIAGFYKNTEISCSISIEFKITVVEIENMPNGAEIKKTRELEIRNDGKIIVFNTEEKITSIENMRNLFVETDFPYYSNSNITTEQLQTLSRDELEYFINFSQSNDIFDFSNMYMPYKFIEISPDLNAYTFLVITDNGFDTEKEKEMVFFELEGGFVKGFDLWSSDSETIIDATIIENNGEIFFQYDKTEYKERPDYLVPNYFTIDVYKLSEDCTKLELSRLKEAYNEDSFEYFYNKSKMNALFDLDFFKKFGKINEEEIWDSYDENATVKTVSFFNHEDGDAGFIYHIKDEMQNTFVYNKFSVEGELLEYSIIEDCISATCADFEVKRIFYDHKPVCNISSRHAAGGFIINIYVVQHGKHIKRLYASQEKYIDSDNENYSPYLYTLIDDEKLEIIKNSLNVDELVEFLKASNEQNEILKMNIETLERL